MIWNPDTPNIVLLYTLDLIATTLCFSGSLMMIFFCFKAPSPKPAYLKFIFAIALSDFLYSFANIMSMFEGHSLDIPCYIEAFIREFAFVLSVFFTSCIAILCHKSLKYEDMFDQNVFFRRAAPIGIIATFFLGIL